MARDNATTTTDTAVTTSSATTSKKKRPHPLKMPLRIAPTSGKPICRFYNYNGNCKTYPQDCDLDHETCHVCLQLGHKALECSVFLDEASFQEFQSTFTLHNTRPDNHPTKTALGDPIVWVKEVHVSPAVDGFQPGDDQLLRCRKQKRIEADYLLQLAPNACYVDVGAHFGDSTLTMALHARNQGRDDIQFVAIEPSQPKCQWIQTAVEANHLKDNVTVICAAVGDADNQMVAPMPNSKHRALRDGSLMYEPVVAHKELTSSAIRMITLDSIRDQLLPLGILHLDVEGWEPQVLKGAKELLSSSSCTTTLPPNTSCCCWIIAEAWTDKEYQRRLGEESIVEGGAEAKVANVMKSYPAFERISDVVDKERNMVYVRKHFRSVE